MKNYGKQILVLASICLGLQGTALAAKDDAKKAPASATASVSAKAELMDINSASKKELATLPKIGDARSDAIIKGRPYRGKDELLSRKILTEDVYNGIKDMIIAKQKTAEKK